MAAYSVSAFADVPGLPPPCAGLSPVTESLFGPPGWQRGPSTLASQS